MREAETIVAKTRSSTARVGIGRRRRIGRGNGRSLQERGGRQAVGQAGVPPSYGREAQNPFGEDAARSGGFREKLPVSSTRGPRTEEPRHTLDPPQRHIVAARGSAGSATSAGTSFAAMRHPPGRPLPHRLRKHPAGVLIRENARFFARMNAFLIPGSLPTPIGRETLVLPDFKQSHFERVQTVQENPRRIAKGAGGRYGAARTRCPNPSRRVPGRRGSGGSLPTPKRY